MVTKPIDDPTEIRLTREDLTPLGHFCMNDLPLMVETDGSRVRIVSNKKFARYMTLLTVGLIIGSVGLWLITHQLTTDGFQVAEKIIMLLCGVLAVVGSVGGYVWRQRYLLARSPLIEVDQETSQVSILGGSQTFALGEVVCLVAFSSKGPSDESASSELQLIVEQNGQRERKLIITSPFGAAWIEFGNLLKQFAKACELPVVITEAQGSTQKEFVLKPLPGKSNRV